MVEDPHLSKHLAHWGIDIMKMQKVRFLLTFTHKAVGSESETALKPY